MRFYQDKSAFPIGMVNMDLCGKLMVAYLCGDFKKKPLHDEMARDEARHGKAFEGLLNRYFGK